MFFSGIHCLPAAAIDSPLLPMRHDDHKDTVCLGQVWKLSEVLHSPVNVL